MDLNLSALRRIECLNSVVKLSTAYSTSEVRDIANNLGVDGDIFKAAMFLIDRKIPYHEVEYSLNYVKKKIHDFKFFAYYMELLQDWHSRSCNDVISYAILIAINPIIQDMVNLPIDRKDK